MGTFNVDIAAVNEKHQPLVDVVLVAYDADLDPSNPNAVLGRATTVKNGFAAFTGLPDDKRIIYKPEITRTGGGLMSVGGIIAAGTGVSITTTVGGITTVTVTGAGVDHGLLTGLADDDHTQYLLLAGRAAASQDISKSVTVATFLRVGSATAPTNTTAGDLTVGRLLVGNAALGANLEAQVTGDMAVSASLRVGSTVLATVALDVTGAILASTTVTATTSILATTFLNVGSYLYVGSSSAPTNTTAGDLTATRLLLGGDAAFANNAKVQSTIASLVPAASTSYYHSFDITVAPDGTNTNERDGLNIAFHVQPTANDGGLHHGFRVLATHDAGAFNLNRATNSLYSMIFSTTQTVGGVVTEMGGVGGAINISAGTATLAQAFRGTISSAGGTVTTAVVFDVVAGTIGTITSLIGLRIANLGAAGVGATNVIGIDITAQTNGATLNFGIRNAGNSVQTGYARFGAVTAPANTAAGDVTATRLVLSSNTAFAIQSVLFIDRAAYDPTAAQSSDLFIQSRIAPTGSGGASHNSFSVNYLVRPSAADGGTYHGIHMFVSHDSGAFNLTGTLIGVKAEYVQSNSAITVSNMLGFEAIATVSVGTATNATGYRSRVILTGATAVTTLRHYDILISSHPTAGTTHVGLNIPNLGNAAWTNAIAIDIAAQSGAGTLNLGIRNAGQTVLTPSAAQNITAAGTAILANATTVQLTADASYTLTSTPTVADGADGQILIIVNVDTVDTITLQDQGTLASSNLRLSANTIALGPRDSIILMYSSTVGDWVEISQTNVL